jgi:hypothetical protein
VAGSDIHDVRLHWLGGDFPWRALDDRSGFTQETPDGPFSARTFRDDGTPMTGTVEAGREASAAEAARGWHARYYGERVAVPSFAVENRAALPVTLVTVLGPGEVSLHSDAGVLTATTQACQASVSIKSGLFTDIDVA